jgi:hypothetical protein
VETRSARVEAWGSDWPRKARVGTSRRKQARSLPRSFYDLGKATIFGFGLAPIVQSAPVLMFYISLLVTLAGIPSLGLPAASKI